MRVGGVKSGRPSAPASPGRDIGLGIGRRHGARALTARARALTARALAAAARRVTGGGGSHAECTALAATQQVAPGRVRARVRVRVRLTLRARVGELEVGLELTCRPSRAGHYCQLRAHPAAAARGVRAEPGGVPEPRTWAARAPRAWGDKQVTVAVAPREFAGASHPGRVWVWGRAVSGRRRWAGR